MTIPNDVQKILDQLEPRIRQAFLDAIGQITSSVQMAAFEEAIRQGDWQRAIQLLNLDAGFWSQMERAISDAFYAGGAFAIAGLPKIQDPFPGAEWSSASKGVTPGRRTG
jgi:hypothetical protein